MGDLHPAAMLTAAIILIITYFGIAFTHLPRLNWDRPTAAFVGAVLMVAAGVLTFQQAVSAIDFNTIALLLGMMVLVSSLQLAGFFQLVAARSLSLARTPARLLILVIVATAISSAFFVNDAVVLLFTPIVIETCRARRLDPVPYLIAEAMASNIGSTATIVGNPQNMLIGMTAGISFARFFLYLLPVAAISTMVLMFITRRIGGTPGEFSAAATFIPPVIQKHNMSAIWRLVPVLVLVLAGFFLSSAIGIPLPLIALCGASAALLIGHPRPDRVLKEVNWLLLVFFAGLFIVIAGAHKAGVLDLFIRQIVPSPGVTGIISIQAVSVALSQLVSNVPLTMLVIPILQNVPGDTLWIALAAGATLGGNLTIIGAVANIIVVEGAAKEGISIGFGRFAKIGIIVTVATILISTAVLLLEFSLGWLK
jgi:Na+/H+ antiporter NhaD/arsenite permease-like protein